MLYKLKQKKQKYFLFLITIVLILNEINLFLDILIKEKTFKNPFKVVFNLCLYKFIYF